MAMALVPFSIKNSLYVRNLSPNVTEAILREIFSPCDEIEGVVFRAFPNQNNQFFAQIDFKTSRGVTEGAKLNGTPIMGTQCLVGVVDPLAAKTHEEFERAKQYRENKDPTKAAAEQQAVFGDEASGAQGTQLAWQKQQKEAQDEKKYRTVHIAGFDKGVTHEALKMFCEHFGEVEVCRVEEPDGLAAFALVEFKERGPAHVVKTQKTYEVDGKILQFTESKTMVNASEFAEQSVHFQAPVFDMMNMRAVLAQQGQLTEKLAKVREAAMSLNISDPAAKAIEDANKKRKRDEEKTKKKLKKELKKAKKEKKERKLKRKQEASKSRSPPRSDNEKAPAEKAAPEEPEEDKKKKKKELKEKKKKAKGSDDEATGKKKGAAKKKAGKKKGGKKKPQSDKAKDATEEGATEKAKKTLKKQEKGDEEKKKKATSKMALDAEEMDAAAAEKEAAAAADKAGDKAGSDDESSSAAIDLDDPDGVDVVANTETIVLGMASSSSSSSSSSKSSADPDELEVLPDPDAPEYMDPKEELEIIEKTGAVDLNDRSDVVEVVKFPMGSPAMTTPGDISSCSDDSSIESSSSDSPVRELAGEIDTDDEGKAPKVVRRLAPALPARNRCLPRRLPKLAATAVPIGLDGEVGDGGAVASDDEEVVL